MKFSEVVDSIKSIGVITRETNVTVIGSQSLHGSYPDRVDEIMYSREVDLILETKASMANWISDVVGEGTMFDQDRGYFIDHVRPKKGLPILAEGWEERATKLAIDGINVGIRKFWWVDA